MQSFKSQPRLINQWFWSTTLVKEQTIRGGNHYKIKAKIIVTIQIIVKIFYAW